MCSTTWPGLAWYRLPALYRQDRAILHARNGGLVCDGYGDVVRRFLFRIHDRPRHPGIATVASAPAEAIASVV